MMMMMMIRIMQMRIITVYLSTTVTSLVQSMYRFVRKYKYKLREMVLSCQTHTHFLCKSRTTLSLQKCNIIVHIPFSSTVWDTPHHTCHHHTMLYYYLYNCCNEKMSSTVLHWYTVFRRSRVFPPAAFKVKLLPKTEALFVIEYESNLRVKS